MKYLDRFVSWYFNKKSLPYWSILGIDLIVVFFSYLSIYWLFNGGQQTLAVFRSLSLNILCYLFFHAIGFKIFKTYSGILRYSSFIDLQRMGLASLFGMLCSSLVCIAWGNHSPLTCLTQRDIFFASLLAIITLWLLRILVKTVYDISQAGFNAKFAYIYGVKEGGVGIAKHIRNEKPMRFILKGFVSEEEETANRILMGLRVHRIDGELVDRMKAEGVEALIISPTKVNDFRNNEKLQDELISAGIRIYISQQPQEWDESMGALHQQIKEISIEDLLPRNEIQVDMEALKHDISGCTIMITGSAGSIGSEMVRQIAPLDPKELILIDQAETPQHDIQLMMEKNWPQLKANIIVTSICNKKRMESIFRKFKPDYVFHAAAYKHVPMMESNPSESIHNNVYGTKVIADLAVKYYARKFVMVSTDKAVNPTNVMGCSKRICEIYVQSIDKAIKNGELLGITQFVTTRFGNVMGSSGSVIPLFEQQIKNGGPITVTDPNIIRFFMLIPEACKLVLEAGTRGRGGEIFVFDMGKPVKIADLAKRMIMLSGAQNIDVTYTGLRPGEKLYEEVLSSEEITKPSFHEKIRIANTREYDYQQVRLAIDRLISISDTCDDMKTVAKMKEIVPEYKSKNSVYEQLDH